MQKIKVKKALVIQALKENQIKFIDAYNIALEGYRLSVIDTLSTYLNDFKKLSLNEIAAFPIVPPIDEQPINYSEEFDIALEMLELEVEDTVYLSSGEFKQYFKNKWAWYNQWSLNNSGNIGIGTNSPKSRYYVDTPK